MAPRFSRSGTEYWMPAFAGMTVPSLLLYLIACGLIGEPVPPVMISGGPQKKNS
jgi:hypothetical protein